jgi:hypothetical protein
VGESPVIVPQREHPLILSGENPGHVTLCNQQLLPTQSNQIKPCYLVKLSLHISICLELTSPNSKAKCQIILIIRSSDSTLLQGAYYESMS